MILNPTRAQAEPSIKRSEALGLDIETTGINFTRRRILMLQLSCTDGSVFIWDIRKGWPTWLNQYLIVKLIIGHNLLFDKTFIQWHYGVRMKNCCDTMLQEIILVGMSLGKGDDDQRFLKLTPEQTVKFSASLGNTLIRYRLPHKGDIDINEFLDLGVKAFTKDMLKYGEQDVSSLHKLCKKQRVQLEARGLLEVANLENEALDVYVQMRVDGIGFDTSIWETIARDYTYEYERRLRRLQHKAPEVTNWNSPVQVKKFFANKGIFIDSFSDLKRIFSKHTMLGQNKLLDEFIEMRQLYQVSHTFGDGWLTKKCSKREQEEPTVDDDGRVHCDFRQIINTGRSSCVSPNLQQLPGYTADKLGGGKHRSAFRPSKGYVFGIADFGGQEFALMMYAAQELVWLDYIRRRYDVHTIMAKQTQGQSWVDGALPSGCKFETTMKACDCPIHQLLRTYSKTITFGMPYGKGPKSMAEDLAIPYSEALRIYNAIFGQLPRLRRWLNDRGRRAIVEKAAYTLAPFNRYRCLELEPEEWRRKNQGMNTPFQGSGGDMIKLAMVLLQRRIDKEKLPARILLQVHDELLTECREDIKDKWKVILQDCMEKAAATITGGETLIKAEPIIYHEWVKKIPKDRKPEKKNENKSKLQRTSRVKKTSKHAKRE